jgi:membrane protease YdiL (CAAX protease family)
MEKSGVRSPKEEIQGRVKPLSWAPSILIMLFIGTLYILAYKVWLPAYIERTGQPYLKGYLWVWGTSMFAVFIISLVLYAHEGHTLTWKAFATRYRLAHLPWTDWLWTLVVIMVTTGLYFGLSGTAQWLASIPVFSPPPLAPPELRPGAAGSIVSGVFFGMPIKGQWWVACVYFIGWLCNILGEEFFYRGWMLPRQELAFGKIAWLLNGTMFTFQHWMQPYNFLGIWPGALFMAWVVQRRRNTWIGIIQHGLMNFGLFLVLVRGVVG